MIRRKLLLDELSQSRAKEPWGESAQLCFKLLYGLPANLQINIAIFMMRRYLPIFEFKNHKTRWPRRLLNEYAQWVKLYGRDVPDEPENADAADAAFLLSFDALLLAYLYQHDDFTLTSSCVVAIDSVINARETNTWIYDDPEAYQMWQKGEWLPERRTLFNPGAIAVSKREWQQVVEWFEQEQVWTYPDEVDIQQMEQELTDWVEREMLLILPKEEFLILKNEAKQGIKKRVAA